MGIRRRFGSVPPIILSTKRSRSYDVMPASRAARYLLASPLSRADKVAYDTRAGDYLNDRVSNASFFSSYALEEGYDTAKKSRNRDAQLLRDATDAIIYSESFATPQAAVAARRVARGFSVPPRATSAPPRPLYPAEVDYWDAPRSYDPLYGLDTAYTTTTGDYYRDLSYARRPLIFYTNPWLYRMPSRVMRRSAERAMSVPPVQYLREEPRQKSQEVPVFDDWRRTTRAGSVPFDMLPYSRPWYLPYYERRLSPYYRRRLAFAQAPSPVALLPLPTEGLRAHKIPRRYLSRAEVRAGFGNLWGYHDEEPSVRRRQEEEDLRYGLYGIRPRVLGSPLARASFARAWRHTALPFAPSMARVAYFRESSYGFPLMYVPRKGPKSGRAKAAIIASQLDVDPLKGRRPRSEYAARKYRAMRKFDQEGIYTRSPQTAAIYASNPPLPKMTERKAIRTDDGYTKPKNILSWQYRLESLMKPSDLLYQPSSFGRIRRQVRAAQEGMDRHRQMLDRYLPEEGAESSDAAARVLRKMAEMDKKYPISGGDKSEKVKEVRSHEAPY